MPRDRSARCGLQALICIVSLTLSNCGQGEDLAGPGPAVLQITTETSGTGTDPDGYIVTIDGHQPVAVALVDTLLENGVTPGEHTVDLAGIAAGCSVEGGSFRSLTAVSGTTASTHFSVTCTAPAGTTGAVVIAVTTSGVELDPDGYLVAMDPSQSRPVETSGQVRIDGLSTGQQLVRLAGLAANCSVQGPNPVTVDVPPDGEVDAAFAVRCWPTARGRIAFVRQLEGVFGDLDSPNSLEVLSSDSGAPRASLSFLAFVGRPAWSPTGDFVALILNPDAPEHQSVLVQPLAGGAAVWLPKCVPTGPRSSWSPDGSQLLCLSSSLEPDPENPDPTPRLVVIKRDGSGSRFLTPDDGTRVSAARYLADGRIFFVADEVEQEGDLGVFRVAGDGTDLTRLCMLPGDVEVGGANVVFSPDGQRLAYLRSRPLGGQWYIANIDGTNAHLVSPNLELSVSSLVWSPDGTQVGFLAGSEDQELWLASPDGSDLRRMPLPGAVGSGGFGWSPDGTRLVVSVIVSHESIFTLRADGTGLERLTATESLDVDPAWAP